MKKVLIKQASVVNEGTISIQDVLIVNERIEKIATSIDEPAHEIIEAKGLYLMPGMIDDQVHFREPGLTHKGRILTESKAAVAGGITSYMDMPNVNPQTVTNEALLAKHQFVAGNSYANYSFYLGATNDNLDQIKALDPNLACGVKIFMGASTGNMLVNDPKALEQIFAHCPILIATHCEDSNIIAENERFYRQQYSEVTIHAHPIIRSHDACYASSSYAVELAQKFNSQLHVLHLTTAQEMPLFQTASDLQQLAKKSITAEACVHHLFFNDQDYAHYGNQIKCNPAIKSQADQQALISAVNEGVIDIIATDHAPHTWQEKQAPYPEAPAGVPLVQHALLMLLELTHKGFFSLPMVVQKTSHAVATRYQIPERGFIREGYFADLVLVDLHRAFTVNNEQLHYQCGWSPFNGYQFSSEIHTTLVNGAIVYQQQQIKTPPEGQALVFARTS